LPHKQSNIGDSMSQAFLANSILGDHPSESWVQGTDPRVDSVYTRYRRLVPEFVQEPESVTGAELVGGGDSFPAQASRVCAQSPPPDHVSMLLGGNDVCNRDPSSSDDATANMYSLDTWRAALRAGLDELAACLPAGATVHVLSTPRVDFLYEAGTSKSWWCDWVVWPVVDICPIVTQEPDEGRRRAVGARIDAYNDAMSVELDAYNANVAGVNPSGIAFVTDWQGSMDSGHADTSVGTYQFGAGDIDGVDCFHPNVSTQARLACIAWATNPDGGGDPSGCFQ
jgi:lysophospholipase L1-like esterase